MKHRQSNSVSQPIQVDCLSLIVFLPGGTNTANFNTIKLSFIIAAFISFTKKYVLYYSSAQQHTIVKDVSSCATNLYFSMGSKNQCQVKMMHIKWVPSFISVHRKKKSQAHSLVIADDNSLSKKIQTNDPSPKKEEKKNTLIQYNLCYKRFDRYKLNVSFCKCLNTAPSDFSHYLQDERNFISVQQKTKILMGFVEQKPIRQSTYLSH